MNLRLVLAIVLLSTAARADVDRFARGEKGMQRDLKRAARTERIRSFQQLLDKKSAFTGARSKDSTWTPPELRKQHHFAVDMGDGITIHGASTSYDVLPNAPHIIKLNHLAVEKNGKRVGLLDEHNVNLDGDAQFWRGLIKWNGPVSRFSVVALLHEMGHSTDWKTMTREEKDAFEDIYTKKTNREPLTAHEHRVMVGFERRAWAHAMKRVHALKLDGIDLLSGTKPAEAFEAITGCLKGYCEYAGKPKTQ